MTSSPQKPTPWEAATTARDRVRGLLPTDGLVRLEQCHDQTTQQRCDRVIVYPRDGSQVPVAEARLAIDGLEQLANTAPTWTQVEGGRWEYVDQFANELWQRLAVVHRQLEACIDNATAATADDGTTHELRLVLSVDQEAYSGNLPWERLRFGARHHPQLTGRLGFVRHVEGEPHHLHPCVLDRRAKVLLLVGDIRQMFAAEAPDAALSQAIDDLRDRIAKSSGIELHVASSMPLRGADAARGGLDAAGVLAVVGQGYDVVHLLLHNDAEHDPKAASFRFGRAGSTFHVTADELLLALGVQPRVVVLTCCHVREALGRRFAERVDHVVGTWGEVDPDDPIAAMGAFYEHWLGTRRVDLVAALRDMRTALHTAREGKGRPGAWRWQHWCRDLRRDPLVFPEHEAVARYLEVMREKHAALNHALARRLPSRAQQEALQQTYVRIDLQHAPEIDAREQLRIDPELARRGWQQLGLAAAGGRCTLRDLLAIRRWIYPWATGRWLLLGGATAGKTSMLRHLVWELCKSEQRGLVPIYVTAQALLDQRCARLVDLLRLPDLQASGMSAAMLGQLRDRGLLLLLCDAIDEVDEDKRAAFLPMMSSLARELRDCPIVLARREAGFVRDDREFAAIQPTFVPVALLPLEPEERRELVRKWVTLRHDHRREHPGLQSFQSHEDAFAALWKRIGDVPWLVEALQNPFVCGLLVSSFAAHDLACGAWEPPKHRHELWLRFLRSALLAHHQPTASSAVWQPGDQQADALLLVLGELALAMFRRGRRWLARDAGDVDRIADEAQPIIEASRELPAAKSLSGVPATAVLAWFEQSGVFGRLSQTRWRFELAGFQDALAAGRMVAMARVNGRLRPGRLREFLIVTRAKDEAGQKAARERLQQIGEALSMVTSYLETKAEVTRWLKRLHARYGDQEVVARALEFADPALVDGAMANKILQIAGSDRAAAIRGLANRAATPGAAIAFLGVFAQSTRRAEDLWVIDEVLRDARFAMEPGTDVVDRRLRVITGEHSSRVALDGDWLTLTVTPRGQQAVTLRFRRIPLPVGPFWMGSPESEAGRYPEREAQHQVVLSQEYWLMETTLTVEHWSLLDPEHAMEYVRAEKHGRSEREWTATSKPVRELLAEADLRHRPAIDVSRFDVQVFARLLQLLLGAAEGPEAAKAVARLAVGLPTEAQWEWASRGGPKPESRFGVIPEASAAKWIVHGGESDRAASVFHGEPQAYELRHMLGNVFEWVVDRGADDYGRSVARIEQRNGYEVWLDPAGPDSGDDRVLRGGAFHYSLARTRCAARNRSWNGPVDRLRFIGARLCLRPPPSS